MTAAFEVGASVRHPARGVGTVVTLIYSPLTKQPFKAWVDFACALAPPRRTLCFVDDLTVVPGERPALALVEPPPEVA